jgi:polyisoprenoid-binding protein YceI
MTPPEVNPRASRKTVLIVSIGLIAVAIGAALIFWFFAGDAPAEVDLAETASEVADDTDKVSSQPADIEGTWTIDNTVGTFTVEEETTATFVGFRVEEELASIGSNTAVGRTPDVSGSITIENGTLTSATITADLTGIVSDESRRDGAIQRSLGTASNPEATFTLTEPIELGENASRGESIEITASGEFTINGVTNQVEITLQAQLINSMILVTGTTDISFADYGVEAPTAPVVLSVEDHGTLEVQLWLAPP